MAAQDFLEYLNSSGSMQDKPKVKDVADEVDLPKGRDTKPPKGQGMVGDQQPYAADGKGVSKGKGDKGFGDQGDSDLKYDATGKPKDVKIPTAEHSFLPGKVRDAALENPHIIEHIVNELNKAGLLSAFVAEMAGYRGTFEALTEIMASEVYGPSVCDRFARSIQESVTPGRYGSGRDEFMPDEEGMEDEEMPDEMADFEGEEEIPEDDMIGGDEEMGDAPFDEAPPEDDELEPGIDGMPPMPKALEHLQHSLKKNFI